MKKCVEDQGREKKLKRTGSGRITKRRRDRRRRTKTTTREVTKSRTRIKWSSRLSDTFQDI